MTQTNVQLPIEVHLSSLIESVLLSRTFVLKSSPGSGKTTRVPLELLKHFSRKILVLEPRRLAAKFAATYIATQLGEEVGKQVGYAFRYERKISDQTRLIFYTEGTFLRLLLNDPTLADVDVVILDEFHERHKETDVAWALLQQLQKSSRPDLKLLVMSATLDQNFFPSDSSFLEVDTPLYPLECLYLDHTPSALGLSLEKKVYEALWKALDQEGDILIFLPGMRDILKVQEVILPLCGENDLELFILHGDLSNDQQAHVMRPGKKRKVILSTNLAESSVTIPGVRIVIDSGLFREASFSPWSGLSHLETKKNSKASAIQRAGRAARTGPGIVYRLYSKHEFNERKEYEKPEILRTDFCELLLFLASLGIQDVLSLPWIQNPPLEMLDSASLLLKGLGAIDQKGLTQIGQQMAAFPLHPRLSRLLVEAHLYSKDKMKEMIHFISGLEEEGPLQKRLSEQLSSLVKSKFSHKDQGNKQDRPLECLLLKGFIDRLGYLKQNKGLEVILCNGENLKVSKDLVSQLDMNHPLVLALDVSSSHEVVRCVHVEEEWLYEMDPFPIEERRYFAWDKEKFELFYYEEERVGQVLLSQNKKAYRGAPLSSDLVIVKEKILGQVLREELAKWQTETSFFRLQFISKILKKDITSFSFDLWMNERLSYYDSFSKGIFGELKQDYFSSLGNYIDPENEMNFSEEFPEKLTLRDRRSLEIHYEEEPWVEGYIQDFYGMSSTPTICKGRIPLTLRLLGPHKRPLQITKDLVSFWNKTYKELFQELSRDYPRHHWPLKPESAPPLLLKRHLTSS